MGAFGDLERLPERAPFEQLLMQDAEIGHLCGKMIGTESSSHLLDLPKLMGSLVWRVARGIGEGELDIGRFDEGYASWRSFETCLTRTSGPHLTVSSPFF